ncbi:hypothetical protein T01_3070 [Trichinella spiralis]|uniref:SCAN domain-containing protein 3 n=1 Tax=Trichinella spiralis TaxID=6334 RepID=A0A0V1B133_TRISP|nr:hypothetical protein T01_3070 [Trichinella spiralis]
MDRKAIYEEKLCVLIKENGQNATIFLTLQHVQIIIGSIGIESVGPKYIPKTEEEIEGFLASEKEANEKERLSSHEEKFEENESHNATLRVRDVDRGAVNLINFLVVIMAECEGIYSVGCREGKLSSKFTAANLQIRDAKDM